MKYKHKLPIQIRFNDIDLVGHVNNAVYQEYFDRARLDYFKDCFKQHIDWNRKGFVIAAIQVEFLSPILLEDKISVATKVDRLGEKSLNMVQFIFKEGQEEAVAKGKTAMVCFDYSNKESIEIPQEWKEMLEVFEGKKLR